MLFLKDHAFVIGKAAGIADTTIMGFFPTTLFVRVFGIMFFFAIAQANGAIELLAKKMIAKFGANARLRQFSNSVIGNSFLFSFFHYYNNIVYLSI